ncbi:MAG: hypothetical protein IPH18_15770 [Chitinophagaceae bacterium]|nr:hypothetical protein [Chitinophagaceae bacterium]
MTQKPLIEITEVLQIHENGNTIVLVTHEEDIANHAHRIVTIQRWNSETDKRMSIRASMFITKKLAGYCNFLPAAVVYQTFNIHMAFKIYKNRRQGTTSLLAALKYQVAPANRSLWHC